MAAKTLFDSCVRRAGDLAGVFEFDGEIGYFYLFDNLARRKNKVIDAIRIACQSSGFSQGDVEVRWNKDESKVGLFIYQVLRAVFDVQAKTKYGRDTDDPMISAITGDLVDDF